ncbi:hypothetical protein ACROYT_G014949 [Oculina patagonica]
MRFVVVVFCANQFQEETPTAILEAMFGKAANLIATPRSVIQKPGVKDGSIVTSPQVNGMMCATKTCKKYVAKLYQKIKKHHKYWEHLAATTHPESDTDTE